MGTRQIREGLAAGGSRVARSLTDVVSCPELAGRVVRCTEGGGPHLAAALLAVLTALTAAGGVAVD